MENKVTGVKRRRLGLMLAAGDTGSRSSEARSDSSYICSNDSFRQNRGTLPKEHKEQVEAVKLNEKSSVLNKDLTVLCVKRTFVFVGSFSFTAKVCTELTSCVEKMCTQRQLNTLLQCEQVLQVCDKSTLRDL